MKFCKVSKQAVYGRKITLSLLEYPIGTNISLYKLSTELIPGPGGSDTIAFSAPLFFTVTKTHATSALIYLDKTLGLEVGDWVLVERVEK